MPAETREDRARELVKEVKEGVSKIQNSEDWKRWLNTNAKFWKYSFGNQMLIALQKPNATRVAGYQTWKELGRWVKKGEYGIRILAPVLVKVRPEGQEENTEKTVSILKGFRTVAVFDLSQTEGKELPTIFHSLKGEAPTGVLTAVMLFLESQDYTVRYDNTDPEVYGYLNRRKEIVLKQGESLAQTLDTLCHEMAHGFLGHLDDHSLSREEKELEAETTAWIVCRNLGLETRDASFAYLATWADEKEKNQKLEKSAHRACEVAKKILDGLEKARGTDGTAHVEREVAISVT